jgi:hypothetical protein
VADEAHVGLVDAHAEGDGGDHHDPSSRRKRAWLAVRSA